MRQLEQDIGDVTQIMKDLARIVHDQGEIVDSIEANVEHASMHVQQVSGSTCYISSMKNSVKQR